MAAIPIEVNVVQHTSIESLPHVDTNPSIADPDLPRTSSKSGSTISLVSLHHGKGAPGISMEELAYNRHEHKVLIE